MFCTRNWSNKLYNTVSFQNFGRPKRFTSTTFDYKASPITLAFILYEKEAGSFSVMSPEWYSLSSYFNCHLWESKVMFAQMK